MENYSKTTTDDSSTSMYYSFNSTNCKTIEAIEGVAEMPCFTDEESEENVTLGAGDDQETSKNMVTVKKSLSLSSPAIPIPGNLLKSFKALSSTPTKMQLLRTVQISRGSEEDVGDLGLSFLELSHEGINNLSENKENLCHDSQKPSDLMSSVIKPKEGKKESKVRFSDLPIVEDFRNVRKIPNDRRSIPKWVLDQPIKFNLSEPTLGTEITKPTKKGYIGDIPSMMSSIMKISNKIPKRKILISRKPDLVEKTRFSVGKKTLNSPGRNIHRKTKVPTLAVHYSAHQRTNVMPSNSHRSTRLPKIISPKKRTVTISGQKGISIEKSRKPCNLKERSSEASMAITESRVRTKGDQSTNLKSEYLCEMCSRKFHIQSLFEAHKRSHNMRSLICSNNNIQCRYCDKIFAKTQALSNHLIENCIKIPPGERKKLLFPSTGQLHKTVREPTPCSNRFSTCNTLPSKPKLGTDIKEAKGPVSIDESMPPPNVYKFKTKSAHSGIYCTPNKQINCHVCKTVFNNILAYTEHSLTHSNINFVIDNENNPSAKLQTDDIKG